MGNFHSLSLSLSSNLRKVKAGPVAKQPFTKRCRIPWEVRTQTLTSRLLPRGTTLWSTRQTTTPPSPGPWRTPPGKGSRMGLPAAPLCCGPGSCPDLEREQGVGAWCSRLPLMTQSARSPGDDPTVGEMRGDPNLPSAVLVPSRGTKCLPEVPAGRSVPTSGCSANADTEPAVPGSAGRPRRPTLAARENHVVSIQRVRDTQAP